MENLTVRYSEEPQEARDHFDRIAKLMGGWASRALAKELLLNSVGAVDVGSMAISILEQTAEVGGIEGLVGELSENLPTTTNLASAVIDQ